MSEYKYRPLPHEQRLLRLQQLGHFHASFDGKATVDDVEHVKRSHVAFGRAVKSFQEFSGLEPDGKLGELTDTALATNCDAFGNRRICNCPDIPEGVEAANIANGTESWSDPDKPILVHANFSLPGLTDIEVLDCFDVAFADINSKIGVRLQLTQRRSDAHVVVDREKMGGGTLAYALLHTGSRRKGEHYQKYASNVNWAPEPGNNGIGHATVAIHEFGHTLGFSHSKDRAAIMWPSYNPNVPRLAPSDVKRMRKYYPPFDGGGDDPADPPQPPKGKQKMSGRFVFGNHPAIFDGVVEWI